MIVVNVSCYIYEFLTISLTDLKKTKDMIKFCIFGIYDNAQLAFDTGDNLSLWIALLLLVKA